MYRIIDGNPRGLRDVHDFIALINSPPEKLSDFFNPKSEIFVARAPGRLDVMGGIADYSGSLVLEMPIAEATLAAVQTSDHEVISIVSLSEDIEKMFSFKMRLSDLEIGGGGGYESVSEYFSRDRSNHWVSYVAGAFFVLKRELGIQFKAGARILI